MDSQTATVLDDYASRIYNNRLKKYRNHYDAEDVRQEAALKLLKAGLLGEAGTGLIAQACFQVAIGISRKQNSMCRGKLTVSLSDLERRG